MVASAPVPLHRSITATAAGPGRSPAARRGRAPRRPPAPARMAARPDQRVLRRGPDHRRSAGGRPRGRHPSAGRARRRRPARSFDVVRLCRALRSELDARIVVVSAAELDDEVVVGALDAGADDVVVGVVSRRWSTPVCASPCARSHHGPPLPAMLEVGDVVVDLQAHERARRRDVGALPAGAVRAARRPGPATRHDDGRPRSCLRTVWGARPGRRPSPPPAHRRQRAARHPRHRAAAPAVETVRHVRLPARRAARRTGVTSAVGRRRCPGPAGGSRRAAR